MEIDKDILNNTDGCESDFGCLTDDNHRCLTYPIDPAGGGEILFINCTDTSCEYHIAFGDATVCNCPTRSEIYRKYKK